MKSQWAAGLAVMLSSTAMAQTAFLDNAPDVPLPPGAVALTASALEPAAPGGQHLVYIVGADAPADAAFGFYAETLPQLGWALREQGGEGLSYVRGRDQLAVRLLEGGAADGRVTLLIEVTSSPASQALD